MTRRKILLVFILLTSLASSALIIPIFGTTGDVEIGILNLRYDPAPVLPDDELNVTCEVVGFLINSFTDNFERAEIGSDWTGMIGSWSIESGYLIQSEEENFRIIFAGNSTWSNYILKLKAKKVGTVENNLNIIFRKGNDETCSDLYLFSLRGDGTQVGIYKGSGDPFQSSEWTELAKVGFQHSADVWYNVLIQVYNDTIKSKIWAEGNSEPTGWLLELSDVDYEAGKIGLLCDDQAAFDDIEVYTYKSNVLIEEVILCYTVNSGTLNKLTMTNIGDGNYQATIPKQTGGTNVSMYIEAVDNLENKITSNVLVYVVQTLPPLPIPWTQILVITSAIVIIIVVWFAFRKGYLAIEIVEENRKEEI